MKFQSVIKYIISVVGAVLLLWVSFKGVDWAMFWQGLKACNWFWIVVSMGIGVCAFLFRALRWRQLLLPIDNNTKFLTCFNAVNISYVANMVLPRIGEFVRCGYITNNSKKTENGKHLAPYDKVLGSVVVDRAWDIVMMLVVLFTILLTMWDKFGYFFINKVFKVIVSQKFNVNIYTLLVGAFGVVVLILFSIIYFRHNNKFWSKIYAILKGVVVGMWSSVKKGNVTKVCLYSVCVWLCYWFTSYTILLAIKGINPNIFPANIAHNLYKLYSLGVFDALFLMLIGAISTLIPVPGGFGAFHYLITLSLSVVYGVPTELGIIFATLTHESQTLIQIICGASSYMCEAFKRKNNEVVIKNI